MAKWLTSDRWPEYLPSDVLDQDNVSFWVEEAERELVQHYTRRKKDVRFRVSAIVSEVRDGTDHLRDTQRDTAVFLRYYDADGATAIDTDDTQKKRFVDAMRAEVAQLVRHYAEHADRKEGVTSRSQGSKSISYESGTVDTFPDGFGRYLEPFDLRPKTTHI